MWYGFSVLKKMDPYHDDSGKFTSAGGEGEGGHTVKLKHGQHHYTVEFDDQNKPKHVFGHYKGSAGKDYTYHLFDHATGNKASGKTKEVIKEATARKLGADAKAQENLKKITPVSHNGWNYEVHYAADGSVSKIHNPAKHAKTGNGTILDASKGDVPTQFHKEIMAKAGSAKVQAHDDLAAKPPVPEKPAPKEGAAHKEVQIHYDGKPYSVTFDEKGQPLKLTSYSIDGKPAPAFDTWTKASGKSFHSGQEQIIDKAKFEAGIKTTAPASSVPKVTPPPAPQADDVETYEGGGEEHLSGVYTDQHGVPSEVVLKKLPLPPEAEAVKNASSKMSGLHTYGYTMQSKRPYGQQDAVSAYQGSAYEAMNEALRDGDLSPVSSSDKLKSTLDEVMASAVVPLNMSMSRGIRASLEEVTGAKTMDDAVGTVFSDAGFVSSSASKSVAETFSSKYGSGLLLKFKLPKGAQGIVMPNFDWEKEVVLPRNATFKITKTYTDKYGLINLECEYLGTKT